MGKFGDVPNDALSFSWLHRNPLILWVRWYDPIIISPEIVMDMRNVMRNYGLGEISPWVDATLWGSKIRAGFCAALYSTRKNGRKAGRFKMAKTSSDCVAFVRLAGLESDVLLLKCWSLTASSTLLEFLLISTSLCWLMESEEQL